MKVQSQNSMFLTGKRTKTLGAVLVLAFVLLATPALASSPTIHFTPTSGPGSGGWFYDGAGTLSFVQDITVDAGLGSGSDGLVGALVHIPDLSVGGIPGGPYTLDPQGTGEIKITNAAGTETYLKGTLGNGDLLAAGTVALGYYNIKVDITGLSFPDSVPGGSAAIDAIKAAGANLDFDLAFTGAPSPGFAHMLNNDIADGDGFTGSMTVKPHDCQLDVTKKACVVVPGGDVCFKGNKVKRMLLEYTGQGCGASSHSQEPKKVKCSGDPGGAEPVDIYLTDKKGEKNWGWAVGVNVGDHVLVDAANEAKNNLDSDTLVIITNAVGDVLQEVQFHTSCSQPLNVGNQFGSMRLFSITTTEGGTVGSDTCITELPGLQGPFDVEYTYTITNNGSTDITNVTVIDDVFGPVPGSPIPLLKSGETEILTLTVSLSDATTNTVLVTGTAGSSICQAEATATITKAPPEPPKCTTKVQAMLLEYIGPTVSGPVTVTIKADKFKDDPTTYTIGGDLVSGTVLSSPAENNWTIDATAHNQSELGSKTKILINGIEEKIHTSCSTPFISGEPAPLDRPKGDPSPNWFVVDFEQK